MSAAPVMTAQDLELEHAELLPVRETLWVTRLYPHYNPGGPMIHDYPGRSPRRPRRPVGNATDIIADKMRSGVKPAVKVALASGRWITATGQSPLLTRDGSPR